jgi:hypothetical protein
MKLVPVMNCLDKTTNLTVLMLPAKVFQKGVRPGQEAKTLMESGHTAFVFAWGRNSQFPSVENVDGAAVRPLRPLSFRRRS